MENVKRKKKQHKGIVSSKRVREKYHQIEKEWNVIDFYMNAMCFQMERKMNEEESEFLVDANCFTP